MKIVVIILLFSIPAILGQAQYAGILSRCVRSSNVNRRVLQNALSGNLPDDPNFKNFLLCFAQNLGVINNRGQIQEGRARSLLGNYVSASRADRIVSNCARNYGSGAETAYQFARCADLGSLIRS